MSSSSLLELPGYSLSGGRPGEDAIEAYERDGVVHLRDAFDAHWVELLAEGMEAAIASAAARSDTVVNIAAPGEPVFFFYDTFMWKHLEQFERFAFESPAADLAQTIMRSETLIFYFDFMLVKEPGTSRKTPWHYDEAYWPIAGSQICNLWTAVDPIPVETGLRFARGSHRRGDHYRAVHFDPDMAYDNPPARPEPPDWDTEPGAHQIVYATMQPGDCLIFHNRTHHSAPGNSLKATRRRALRRVMRKIMPSDAKDGCAFWGERGKVLT